MPQEETKQNVSIIYKITVFVKWVLETVKTICKYL